MGARITKFLASSRGALGRRAVAVLALLMLLVGLWAMRDWAMQMGADPRDMVAPTR
jgi:hypothetical protein